MQFTSTRFNVLYSDFHMYIFYIYSMYIILIDLNYIIKTPKDSLHQTMDRHPAIT